ncbi:MAG: PEP-CTERM sorting domain-containing protein [Fimbriimonadaceae bacterium]|nr:PEP-CTERM sorting domain-containing protein [Fimbriimonadaceae bacterium]
MLRRLAFIPLLLASAFASAQTVFDFEDQPESLGLTNLVLNKDGIEMELFRDSGRTFDVFDTDPFIGSAFEFPGVWGTRVLAPFAFQTEDDLFVANFNQEITEFWIDMGDFGADEDDLQLRIYSGLNGTGDLIDSIDYPYGLGSIPNFETVTWTSFGQNARSVLFRGGSPNFPNSVYMDNITVTPVPEPATLAFLGLGGLAFIRRRKPR